MRRRSGVVRVSVVRYQAMVKREVRVMVMMAVMRWVVGMLGCWVVVGGRSVG